MKKVLLTFAVVIMAIAANAQVWMGGSFGFTSTKASKDVKPVYNYSIAPEVGFVLTPELDLAIGLKYAGQSFKDEVLGAPVKENVSTISVQPYLRYKAINCGKVGFFIDGGFEYGYGMAKATLGTVSEEGNTSYFMVGLKPGVSFAASDNITFAARIGSLGYYKQKDGESRWGVNVDNSAFTFGVYWTF